MWSESHWHAFLFNSSFYNQYWEADPFPFRVEFFNKHPMPQEEIMKMILSTTLGQIPSFPAGIYLICVFILVGVEDRYILQAIALPPSIGLS
jgi:hypothetical protein